MRRNVIVLVGALLLMLVVGVGGLVLLDAQQVDPVVAAAPVPAKSAPDVPASQRVALPAPPGVDLPPPSRTGRQPVRLTPEDRRLMNFSVDDVLRAARADCLQSWVNAGGQDVEIVFDVLLSDGRVMDIGMRSLGQAVPQEVVGCVADKAWIADWPEWDLPGELRLQRAITMKPVPEEP